MVSLILVTTLPDATQALGKHLVSELTSGDNCHGCLVLLNCICVNAACVVFTPLVDYQVWIWTQP